TFSIRIIRNKIIDIEKFRLRDIINQLKEFHSGLVLITGKVNSGKTTTLNAFVQEINKTMNKKVVMLEEPIEYRHKSNKSVIVQKEVNKAGDIPTYYDGVINLLREDSDIAIIGEIRDRKTMDAVLDLAESGGLVIGTLHTRSCGETIDRIIGMYEPNEQKAIKYSLSNVLKMVVSQKLVKCATGGTVLVPESMVVNATIAALIRQEKFNVSEIQDAVHHSHIKGTISFERSFTELYNNNIIDMDAIKNNVEESSLSLITNLIGGGY
ncbi:MAG: Flp pilus assembly complex ATPase component TadA, partial [Clostridia bacterium]|nr:Flp pilus assembly complex ATPase component TadA [Clostridia bacterium]